MRGFSVVPGSRIYLGNIIETQTWGLAGNSAASTVPDSNPVQNVNFTYAYDTGHWSFQVGTNSRSGDTSRYIALDTVRIGAGKANLNDPLGDRASINVDNILVDVSTVPEPSTLLLLGAGLSALAFIRRRSKKQ